MESLLLHEQEQERLAQERIQAEQLNAALREFHAQPNLSKFVPVHIIYFLSSFLKYSTCELQILSEI